MMLEIMNYELCDKIPHKYIIKKTSSCRQQNHRQTDNKNRYMLTKMWDLLNCL